MSLIPIDPPSTAEGGEGGAAERATGGVFAHWEILNRESPNTSRPRNPTRPPCGPPPSPRFAQRREISRRWFSVRIPLQRCFGRYVQGGIVRRPVI